MKLGAKDARFQLLSQCVTITMFIFFTPRNNILVRHTKKSHENRVDSAQSSSLVLRVPPTHQPTHSSPLRLQQPPSPNTTTKKKKQRGLKSLFPPCLVFVYSLRARGKLLHLPPSPPPPTPPPTHPPTHTHTHPSCAPILAVMAMQVVVME